jgi:hypothetical protein
MEDGLGFPQTALRRRRRSSLALASAMSKQIWKKTHHSPLPGAPNVDGFRVARTWGTTRRTQRFERRGLNVRDLRSQQNTVTEASSHRTHYALQRETPSFTQVQGPRGEVKPLLPAFLYCNATPREEYKALVTKALAVQRLKNLRAQLAARRR